MPVIKQKATRHRKDNIFRAFTIIELFRRGRVTVELVSRELEISKRNAQKWIDAASCFLPVYEVGWEPHYSEITGRAHNKHKVYGLLK